jgi:hypothetical protein
MTPPVFKKPNLTPHPKVEQAFSTDMQEANRPMNEELPDPEDQEAQDQKAAPRSYHGYAEGGSPEEDMASIAQPREQHDGEIKYSAGDRTEPQADIPMDDSTSDTAEDTIQEDMEGNSQGSSMEDTLDQHLDNAKDFHETLPDSSESGQSSEMDELLDAHIANAADLEDEMDSHGVSRPEDYDQKDRDMGLSEDDAGDEDVNLHEVLRAGLDDHADSIRREKAMNMVGEALEAFKAQKGILDKAREQAPEFYGAAISMLRAMIELCSVAGIDQSQAAEDVSEIESQGCPTCGKPQDEAQQEASQEAAPAEAQESPEAQSAEDGSIGSVKKLPTKHSTPHIAKEPTPEGGVNPKGQKRYKDPTTGKDAYIDMKRPMIMGPRGIPVKS